jgi:hypothetical protein
MSASVRITSYEGKRRAADRMENNVLIRIYDLRGLDNIPISPINRIHPDCVARVKLSEPPEKCIAVCRQSDIPVHSRQRGPRYVTDCTPEDALIDPFDKDRRYSAVPNPLPWIQQFA